MNVKSKKNVKCIIIIYTKRLFLLFVCAQYEADSQKRDKLYTIPWLNLSKAQSGLLHVCD